MRKKFQKILTVALMTSFAIVGAMSPFPHLTKVAAAGMRTVDIYVLAGQSNAAGWSKLENSANGIRYTDYLARQDGRNSTGYSNVLYYGTGAGAESTNDTFYDSLALTQVKMGLGFYTAPQDISIGPELGMANELSGHYTEENAAAIVKFAAGGTYLGDWEGESSVTRNYGGWASPSLIEEWKSENKNPHQYCGVNYEKLIGTVGHAIDALREEGYKPTVKGYIWMQGEADSEQGKWANVYEHNLELFINDLRTDIAELTDDESAKNRPFVIGKIARDYANRTESKDLETVRSAQDALADKMKYVYTVDTDDLSIGGGNDSKPNGSDIWHFNAGDMYTLGRRFAATAYAKHFYNVTIGEGGTLASNRYMTDNDPFTIGYELGRGIFIDKILLNGEDITATAFKSGVITITPDENSPEHNNIEIVLRGSSVRRTLTVNVGTGGRIVSRSPSGNAIYEGEEVVLKIKADNGYAIDKVLANGAEVLPDENARYIVIAGAEDCVIDVSFKSETEQPSEDKEKGDGLSPATIGIVVGASIVGVAAAVAITVTVLKKKKKK